MPRYYFHLEDGSNDLKDPDGMELLAAGIPAAALLQARDCIAGDVKRGRLELHLCINVHTEDGELMHSLAFGDALEVIGPR